MTITIEAAQNNDPRLALGIPVFDLFLEELGTRYQAEPSLLLPWLSSLPSYQWLDRCNALVLFEERWEVDLDVMVLVCVAVVPESERIWHSLSEDGNVPTAWEGQLTQHP